MSVDQPSITLELDALNVVRAAAVTFRPVLSLRCLNEKLEAVVATGAARTRDSHYRATVRLRWADRPPLEERWRRSTDYSAVFAPDPGAFVQQLLATPEVTFELPDAEDPIVAQFNGAGLDAHLQTLRARCRSFPVAARGVAADTVYAEAQVDEQAALLTIPEARYPPLLRRAGIRGTVIVQAVIDTLGRVAPGTLRVISSPNSGFNEPALEAVQRAVFRPARVRGHAVRVRVRLPIEFKAGSPR